MEFGEKKVWRIAKRTARSVGAGIVVLRGVLAVIESPTLRRAWHWFMDD